jgi:hypothetical protein
MPAVAVQAAVVVVVELAEAEVPLPSQPYATTRL